MAVLKYTDLIEEVNREMQEKALEFEAKDGKTVLLRPLMLLGKEELKVAQTMLKVIADENADTFARIEAMDTMLVASADKKDSLKKSLVDLPPPVRTRIFNDWMAAGKAGEASA